MKKIALLVQLLVMLLCLAAAVPAAEYAGQVAFLQGSVQIIRGAERMPASLKLPVMQGDTIVTADSSLAKLLMRDDSVLTVYPDSRLEINEYVYNPSQKRAQSSLKLLLGKLRAVIAKATVNISTKTAVAGIKGTKLDIWHDEPTQTTWLLVHKNVVEIRNSNPKIVGSRIVKAGEMTSVPVNEPPRPVQPIPAKMRELGGEEGGIPGERPILARPEIRASGLPPDGADRYLKPRVDVQPRGASTPVQLNVVFP